jgi:hypothetical protein
MFEPGPIRNWHQIAVGLLMTDVDLALLAFAALVGRDDRETVARRVREARESYDAIRLRRKTIKLSGRESASLDDKMDRLRAGLRFFGEAV